MPILFAHAESGERGTARARFGTGFSPTDSFEKGFLEWLQGTHRHCMERPKRTASKVVNFRTYHLSGDLDKELQGRVGQVVNTFEEIYSSTEDLSVEMSETEKLQKELDEKRAANKLAAQQAEEMRIRNELEEESLKEQEWELAFQQMRDKREKIASTHKQKMEDLKKMADAAEETGGKEGAIEWLQAQLKKIGAPTTEPTEAELRARKEREEKEKKIAEVRAQQEKLAKQMADLTGETINLPTSKEDEQAQLLQQLHNALESRPEDPQKAMLRALTTRGNKLEGPGGVNRLNPDILGRLNSEAGIGGDTSEWLANFNKAEEGESLLKLGADGEGDCRHTKLRSGMLDKSTMNIKQKQVWPQKNLGEDWAEEEMDFKTHKIRTPGGRGNSHHRNMCRTSTDIGQTQATEENILS